MCRLEKFNAISKEHFHLFSTTYKWRLNNPNIIISDRSSNMEETALNEDEFYNHIDKMVPGDAKDATNLHPHRKIYLERISLSGVDQMYEYSIDPLLYQHLDQSSPPQSKGDMKKYLKNLLDQVGNEVPHRTRMMWFIKKINDDRIIGTISILDIDYKRQMTSWSFGLGSMYWGKGYSFEMLDLAKMYIFDGLKLNRIYGCTNINNHGVINLLKVHGAKKEGVARQAYRGLNKEYSDGWMYSILSDDYFSNKKEENNEVKSNDIIKIETLASIVSKVLGNISINGTH
jgi:RimJ/RimL family protein N-acetyltransferase